MVNEDVERRSNETAGLGVSSTAEGVVMSDVVSSYLLFLSQDPFTSCDAVQQIKLAQQLQSAGHRVFLFLVENGVLPARPSSASHLLTSALQQGVTVYADDFALRERGITHDRLLPHVTVAGMREAVDHIESGCKTIWV